MMPLNAESRKIARRAERRADKEKGPAAKSRKPLKNLVPEGGVEPPRVLPRRILSPLRLPFRHSGVEHQNIL